MQSTTSQTYYGTLEPEKREALFKVMRTLGTEELSYRRKAQELTAPFGTISVGTADFDEVIKAEVIASFLRALRQGLTPDDALRMTETERTQYVQKFNSRGVHYSLKRSEDAEQSMIERIHRQVLQAVGTACGTEQAQAI